MAGTFSTPSSSGVSRRLNGVRLVPRMVPPRVRMPLKSSGFHKVVATVDKALVAVLETVDLNGLVGVVDHGLDDAAHGGVQRLAVAAAGKKSNPGHGSSPKGSNGVRRRPRVGGRCRACSSASSSACLSRVPAWARGLVRRHSCRFFLVWHKPYAAWGVGANLDEFLFGVFTLACCRGRT